MYGIRGMGYAFLCASYLSNSPRPMSLISVIFGSDDDQEILDTLYSIVNVRLYLCLKWLFDLDITIEYVRAWVGTRIKVDLPTYAIYKKLVCLGEQLLRGDASGPRSA